MPSLKPMSSIPMDGPCSSNGPREITLDLVALPFASALTSNAVVLAMFGVPSSVVKDPAIKLICTSPVWNTPVALFLSVSARKYRYLFSPSSSGVPMKSGCPDPPGSIRRSDETPEPLNVNSSPLIVAGLIAEPSGDENCTSM